MKYIELFEELASNNSRLFKEELLTKHKDDETLKQIIVAALNPFTQYYIRKIPSYTPNFTAHAASIKFALGELSVLSSREKTGNEAIQFLTTLLEAVNKDDSLVLIKIIEKDLDCGVSIATVNKIWPDLIPEYPVMLCSQYDDKLISKMKWPAYVQTKLDGMRANIIVKNGKVELRSRNGKEIHVHGVFDNFVDIAQNKDIVFDGELMVKGDNNAFLDRKTGNGILNKCVKGTVSAEEASNIHFVLYDIIDYSDFIKGKSNIDYLTRFQRLIDFTFGKAHNASIVNNHVVNDIEKVQEICSEHYSRGEEGIILKRLDGVWEDKRSKSLIKFKAELEAEFEIIDWIEGTGRNVGRLGALTIASADRKIQCNVGTGFSDEQRDQYTKENTIGKIASIQYNARIQDKNGGVEKLFLPVFIEIRSDKTEADHSKDIK